MSLNREKVDYDPLSFFGNEPKNTFDDDTDNFVNKSLISQPEEFRNLDVSKVKFQEKKKNDKSSITNSNVLPSVANPPKEPVATIPSLISDTSPKKQFDFDTLERKSEEEEENIFLAAPSVIETKKAEVSFIKNEAPTRKFIESEDQIHDLKVSALLEREDNLNYDIFGKLKSKESDLSQTSTTLDSEFNFLKELDNITSIDLTKSTTTDKSPKPSTLFDNIQPKSSTGVDLSALNLDDYISQQESSSGGGLFD